MQSRLKTTQKTTAMVYHSTDNQSIDKTTVFTIYSNKDKQCRLTTWCQLQAHKPRIFAGCCHLANLVEPSMSHFPSTLRIVLFSQAWDSGFKNLTDTRDPAIGIPRLYNQKF